MRSMRSSPSALAALLLAAVVVAAVPAQEAARPEPGSPAEAGAPEAEVGASFFERIAVDVVNVEVYVTDREGEPVPGLTAEDFEVREDGRPVEVVNFYSVFAGVPAAAGEPPPPATPETAPGPAPAPPSAPRAEPPLPESQRLHLIVYVDNANIHPFNRNRVFRRIRDFLRDTVTAGDRVMVASYDRSLHIRHPFTGDPEAVGRTLLDLEEISAAGGQRESERAEAVQAIYEADSLHEAQWRAKQFAENAHHELLGSLDALNEMVASLAGIPGRKMLLHVSDGLPTVPGQDLYQALQQRFADLSVMGEAFSRDESRAYMELIAQANSNRVSFYTIDAGGLRTHSGFGAENPAVNTGHVVSTAVDAVRKSNLQGTLQLMARRTGGQSIVNTNDVGPGLARFGRDFDNYYSLGYRAPVADRGRYHKIEVRLRDGERGWSVRHREGYRDKSVTARIADGVAAFLAHGYEINPLGASMEFGSQVADGEGFVDVAIRVRVPLEGVLLVPQGDVHVARLRLYLAAVDGEGRQAPLTDLPLELRVPEAELERARRDEVVRVLNAKMRPGLHKVVVGVRDEIAEERSIVGRHLRVEAPGSG